MHDPRLPRETDNADTPHPATRMIAELVEITQSDAVAGRITSRGRLVDSHDRLLARFVQSMRLVRGLPAAIIDVDLELAVEPEGEIWDSYVASRLACRGDIVAVRQGVDWVARETGRRRFQTPEWLELSDDLGCATCFGLGLPFHRLAGPKWLDTQLAVAGETRRHFQMAVGLDCRYPTQTALALLTAGNASITNLRSAAPPPHGWLLHVSAKNILVTHLEPLAASTAGMRLRVLETEGRRASGKLSAFRPICAARRTDFTGRAIEDMAVVDGSVPLDVSAHDWLQIEAEWSESSIVDGS
jgi:hypothetical protein